MDPRYQRSAPVSPVDVYVAASRTLQGPPRLREESEASPLPTTGKTWVPVTPIGCGKQNGIAPYGSSWEGEPPPTLERHRSP